jgi:hypothetical protein
MLDAGSCFDVRLERRARWCATDLIASEYAKRITTAALQAILPATRDTKPGEPAEPH